MRNLAIKVSVQKIIEATIILSTYTPVSSFLFRFPLLKSLWLAAVAASVSSTVIKSLFRMLLVWFAADSNDDCTRDLSCKRNFWSSIS